MSESMVERAWKSVRREPFALATWVAFLCILADGHKGGLWMFPAWLAIIFAAGCADELWQRVVLNEPPLSGR